MLETVQGQPVLQAGPLCKYEKRAWYQWIWNFQQVLQTINGHEQLKLKKKVHVINAGTTLIQTRKGKQTELHFKEYDTMRCTTN